MTPNFTLGDFFPSCSVKLKCLLTRLCHSRHLSNMNLEKQIIYLFCLLLFSPPKKQSWKLALCDVTKGTDTSQIPDTDTIGFIKAKHFGWKLKVSRFLKVLFSGDI